MGVFLSRYARSLVGVNRHAEAEEALLEAHDRLAEALGPDDDRTRGVVDGLADLYDSWGKPDLAQEWRGRAAK